MEEERQKIRQGESTHKDLSLQWLKERDDLRQIIADAKTKTDQSNASLVTREIKFKELVNSISLFNPIQFNTPRPPPLPPLY